MALACLVVSRPVLLVSTDDMTADGSIRMNSEVYTTIPSAHI